MADEDALAKRGKSLEEEYFRRKDRELIEKMRETAEAEKARGDMARQTGLADPALLAQLQELGFTPETVSLLPLFPVLEMAWEEGDVTSAERDLLIQLARSRGIQDNSVAGRQLEQWMAHRPQPAVFERARRLIGAMLSSGTEGLSATLNADDLVDYCEKIAAASGGLFGIGRVSTSERALLNRIASDLKTRKI
ncbi:MAG: hypothetical protein AB7F99_14095 [Vicinamibacterales bacterium]